MTAIEVLKTITEICDNNTCRRCPLCDVCDVNYYGDHAEEIVNICEEWRTTHEISD